MPFSDQEMGRLRRKFGMVFQYAALFDSMNVVENIAFPLIERYKLTQAEILDRVRALLQRLDLADVAGIEQKFPPQLSGGQRKRVGLARALIDRPEILLYDEPTTGLDPVATRNVDQMIRQTSRDFGVTSVVISHDMASTFRIGDRIAMLSGGVIIVSGTPEEVLASDLGPLREFVETSGSGGPAGGGTRVRKSWASVTVGALVLFVAVFSYWLIRATNERGARSEGYTVYGLFHDAAGLFEKSRVQTAGISVGQIDKRELDAKTIRAKITVRIKPEITLYENAVVAKKSASLLGEYYLEIDPGSAFAEVDGQKKAMRVLKDGDQI